jgi:hypothetical protein
MRRLAIGGGGFWGLHLTRRQRAMALCWVVVAALGLSGSLAHASIAEDKPLGHLCWGMDPATGAAWTQASLRHAFERDDDAGVASGEAEARSWISSGKTFRTVERITIAGYLPGQISFDQSVAALQEMKMLVPLALCARGSNAELRVQCQRAGSEGVFAWMRAYSSPTGQPIDESNLLPLLLATDLLEDTWSGSERAEASHWLDVFLASSERYREEALKHSTDVSYGNFESWRLMLSLVAATVADKEEDTHRLALLWQQQLDLNVGQDGRTWDLRRRGSLHYQSYDLEPMIWVHLFVPWAFTKSTDGLVKGGVMYLEPYYDGSQTYIEFAHPDPSMGQQIAFDVTRRDAGMPEFQLKNWNPEDAHLMLHLAAAAYPEVRQWLVRDRPDAYPVMIRQIVAMHRGHAGGCTVCGPPLC